jgi:hypothetical protein
MEEKGKSGVWRVVFIPHSTLAAWSSCMWDRVGPQLLKELGPLHNASGGKNVYGQWTASHPISVQRWEDGVVRVVVVEVPAAALGSLSRSDTEYQQYKLGTQWADRLLKQVPKWGSFWTLSAEAVQQG